MVLCQYKFILEDSGADWPTIISSTGAVLIGVIAIVFSYIQSNRSYNEKRLEEKRLLISRKLDEFYGPLLQLRKKSNILYSKFSKEFKEKDESFTTLTYLLKGYKFTGNSKVLLEEIIKIGEQCENLIHSKAGLVDDIELRNVLLPRATTHFLVIRLAFQGSLKEEDQYYRDLTFPHLLDSKLEARKLALEKELDVLLKC